MWERMAASGLLVVGAVVLFVVFMALLFIMEHKGEKKRKVKTPPLRVGHTQNTKRAA